MGNIRSVDPSGPRALGYFSLSRSVERRIYVEWADLPYPFNSYEKAYPSCSVFDVDTLSVADYMSGNKSELLIAAVTSGPAIIGYTTAEKYCIDCTLAHGGVNIKPDFWE